MDKGKQIRMKLLFYLLGLCAAEACTKIYQDPSSYQRADTQPCYI